VGSGIHGIVEGHEVVVGSPAFVRERAWSHSPELVCFGADDDAHGGGVATPLLAAVDGVVIAGAWLGDAVRADAAESVAALRGRGWRVGVLSGDAQEVANHAGVRVGVPLERCIGGASPERKLEIVHESLAQRRPGPVVMVGDGINDAAAIAASSVGIGVHGGAEACLATADVYLARPGLGALVELVRGAERTMSVIRRNIVFSVAYNVVGATLAMAGVLTPLIAAILMPASSLTVVLASWRSRTFRSEVGA
jgi:Cu2+-exporting ATPase